MSLAIYIREFKEELDTKREQVDCLKKRLNEIEILGAEKEKNYGDYISRSEKQISELQEQINGLVFSGETQLIERMMMPSIGNFLKDSGLPEESSAFCINDIKRTLSSKF